MALNDFFGDLGANSRAHVHSALLSVHSINITRSKVKQCTFHCSSGEWHCRKPLSCRQKESKWMLLHYLESSDAKQSLPRLRRDVVSVETWRRKSWTLSGVTFPLGCAEGFVCVGRPVSPPKYEKKEDKQLGPFENGIWSIRNNALNGTFFVLFSSAPTVTHYKQEIPCTGSTRGLGEYQLVK